MTLYGQKVIYLSDLVRKFCLKQGNVKMTGFLRQMEMASWAWKELFRKSIWELTTVVLEVDPIKHTITLPDGCERMVNISVIDKFGKIQPLTLNPNMNTASVLCQKNACKCACGGTDTLCEALENITALQDTIVVNDHDYTQVTYIKSDGCGAIQKEVHTFGYNPETEEVEPVVINTLLCNIEVNSRGCILPTKPNILALQDYCGVNATCVSNAANPGCAWGAWQTNAYRSLVPAPYNYYGQWNWDAAARDTIHIFRSRRCNAVFVNDPNACNSMCGSEQNDIRKVIISYQTIGATEGVEILVPEYAQMAVDLGIMYQQALYNPRDGDRNGTRERQWNKGQKKVQAYLNPVRIDDMIKLQTNQRPW